MGQVQPSLAALGVPAVHVYRQLFFFVFGILQTIRSISFFRAKKQPVFFFFFFFTTNAYRPGVRVYTRNVERRGKIQDKKTWEKACGLGTGGGGVVHVR
ncbi:hypothetical protein BDY19DRAFT_969703 [Irpex rosettiformis]|uniref:Uncharacterized protein n=1 Tax=Irpex rosettiformis TaxID=378272 RepID=A0ACB8TSB1_9APHY|nr:hypothetical protein BDY19DRAFT_969703 [Irpex rosettiformis]